MKLFTRTKLLLVHLSRRLKCTVVCLASLTFAFFISPLKPLNGTEFNESWQETRSQSSLPSLCLGRSGKQDGRPGLWFAVTFSTSPLKPLNGIQRILTGNKISKSSTKCVFSGRSGKQDGRPTSDLLRHFRLLLWNHWTEFNETWQEARYQRPLPNLCFSGQSDK